MKNKHPKFHFSEKKAWINDPNGCIYHNGEYHLFYQLNPYDTKWGPMHWGHAVTKDFVNWEYKPIALTPDKKYEQTDGCFSGSAILKDNKINLLYTATRNFGDDYDQTQCLAIESGDGFEKFDGNPLIKRPVENVSRDFRDPKVLFHDGAYYMVVGSSTLGARENGDGLVLLYKSDDLESWEYKGILFKSNGQYGTMFECPDLINVDGKWVLIFSPMFYGDNKSTYIIGECDFEHCVFTPEYSSEIDFGTDYYAPQSFSGAEKPIIIAWQNGWEWMPWYEGFGCADVFSGSMSLVRELSIKDNKLVSKPVSSYDKFFKKTKELKVDGEIEGTSVSKIVSDDITSGTELQLKFGDEKIVISFKSNEVLFDRSGLKEYYSNIKSGSYNLKEKNNLELYIDENSIELFINDGEFSMSNLIFPNDELTSITSNTSINLSLYEFDGGMK